MRFTILCLVLGGCAIGAHANSTDQGMRLEAGFYPTEAAGDFNVKMTDADTRRKYADACAEVKTPADCLFALSLGANPETARLAFRRGGNVCWRDGGLICRPFGGSARDPQPTGAQYDVGAVTTEYQTVFASLSLGPDIVSPRPAYLAMPTEAPVVLPSSEDVPGGKAVVNRDREPSAAPRQASLPRPVGDPTLSGTTPSGECVYQKIQQQYARLKSGLINAQKAQARRYYEQADRVLSDGIRACARASTARTNLLRVRAELTRFAQRHGLKQQET